MKKVSLLFALFLSFAAASIAQPGQAKCAWSIESAFTSNQSIMPFTDIILLGISDSEGDPVYSVSLTANFTIGEASKVVLTEIKTGKKWLMNQVTPMTKSLPAPCNTSNGLPGDVKAYRSSMTNTVVYVCVPTFNEMVYVYAYKPLDIKIKI